MFNLKLLFLMLFLMANISFAWDLKLGVTTLPTGKDLTQMWNYQHFLISNAINRNIVEIQRSGKITSGLAKRWEIDKSGKKYHFVLHDEIYFEDLTQINSQDVKNSLNYILREESKSVVKDYLQNIFSIEDIEIINQKEFVINLKKPFPPFLAVLAMPGFGIVKPKDGKIITSGRYYVKEIAANNWKLIKREKLAEGPDLIDINLINLKDRSKNLSENDLVVGLMPTDLNLFNEKGFVVSKHNSQAFVHFYFNTSGTFKDIQLRQKMFNILKNGVLNEYLRGLDFYESMNTFFVKGVLPYNYYKNRDITYNKSALDKENLKKYQIKMLLRKEYFNEKFEDILQKYFKKESLNIKITWTDSSNFIKDVGKKDYDIVSAGYLSNFADPSGFTSIINRKSNLNYGDFPTDELFKKISEVDAQSSKEKRLQSYSDLFKKFEENIYFVPGFQIYLPLLHKSEIKLPDWNYKYEGELWRVIKESAK